MPPDQQPTLGEPAVHPPQPPKKPWWRKPLARAAFGWFMLGGWLLFLFPVDFANDRIRWSGVVVLVVALLSVAWYAFWVNLMLDVNDPDNGRPPEF
ncbi:MAG TPA: hypothetical protein VFB06_37765 [Streptosporangiaceae bacterium]|nr:hypothetical protein [Streptosporangiaceae bacterium]